MLATLLLLWSAASNSQELASLAGDGSQGNSFSEEASISDDGRFVAFQSSASNFAIGDIPPVSPFGSSEADIFVVDTQAGSIELISAGLDGLPANSSRDAEISADGRYVAFGSFADNLAANDQNMSSDVFFFDRQTRQLTRISEGQGGADADGASDGNAISPDGSVVAFESVATNLIADDANGLRDIFLWLRDSNTIERVSVASDGSEANGISDQPALSRDGRYVVFESQASNLVPGDTNGRRDIFLVDRVLDTIERVDVAADGSEANANSEHPSISDDGRFVAFESRADNLTTDVLNGTNNIFVKDRQTGAVTLISQSTGGVSADAFCEWPSISPDGRLVVFDCPGDTLVEVDTGGLESVYLHDRLDGTTTLISTGFQDPSGNNRSLRPSMGADAVAFTSLATNLVPNDVNGEDDVFVVRLGLFKNGFEAAAEP